LDSTEFDLKASSDSFHFLPFPHDIQSISSPSTALNIHDIFLITISHNEPQ
jgi:hypothetical protein